LQHILLAKQMPADLLLIDDKAGRMTAKEHSLTLMGTLGILELAEIQGQIDLSKVLQKLLQTNIKLSPSLIRDALTRHQQRCQSIEHPS